MAELKWAKDDENKHPVAVFELDREFSQESCRDLARYFRLVSVTAYHDKGKPMLRIVFQSKLSKKFMDKVVGYLIFARNLESDVWDSRHQTRWRVP